MKIKLNSFSYLANYKNHVRGVVLPHLEEDSKKISYWRNESFCSILTYITPLSLIALIPGVYLALLNGLKMVAFADLFTFFTLVLITVSSGIKLKVRKSIFIFILYFLSITLLYYLHMPGPGLLFLLTVTIFSSLIYSAAAAYYSALTNCAICIFFALLLYFRIDIPISIGYDMGKWVAVSSNLVFLSFGCTLCLDLLLAGLNESLESNTISEQKLQKTNRLYQFISQINQSIVHTKDEEALFNQCCQIAFTAGKFKMAWIGKFDYDYKKILLVSQNGIPESSIPLFSNSYQNNAQHYQLLHSRSHYVCNDIENDLELESLKPFAKLNGIKSCTILPIKKFGIIIGSFNIYADEINFFDDAEIALLEEATGDISFALDVFEKEKLHKQSEELIIKNENRFRTLIEKSKDIKMLTNINGEFIYGSPSVTKLLGYSIEEIMHKSAHTFFHPDDLPILLNKRSKIFEVSGGSFPFQYRFLHKNGTWMWCEGTLTNMLHEPGINAFVSNFRDISERKQAEQDLISISKNLQLALGDLQKIMDSSLDIICSINEEGMFVSVSKAAENVLGFPPNELVGKKYINLVLAEDVEKTNQIATEIINGNPVTFFENRYLHKNGSTVNIMWSAKWDSDSKLMYCIAKDVTERNKIEQEKEKMSNDLIRRSKNLEQFAYIVSHNLRAPLANILGFTELLKNENSSHDLFKDSMKGISIAAHKLDDVIKDLNEILQISSIVSENKEVVHFQNLVDDISLSINNVIKKEDVIIKTDFTTADKMLSVKSYLYSIFYNLIINSIKFHKFGVKPIIEIQSQQTKKGLQIIFKDNGLGIDLKKHNETIFGLYKRFHFHTEGKGMGMFMIKTQVETLGGKISITSELNEGTQFTIEFENIN